MNVFLLHNDEVLYKGHTINQGSLNIIVVYVALPTTKEMFFQFDGVDTFSVTVRAQSMSSRLVKLSEGVICRAPAFWTSEIQPWPRSCTRVLIWKPTWKKKSHRWLNKKEKIFKKVISVRPQPGPHTSSGSAVWAASRLWTANWP